MQESKPKKNIIESLVPAILVVTVGLSFAVGVLWQKVQSLEGGTTKVAANNNAANNNAKAPVDPSGKLTKEQAGKVPKVTDKDHIRGDKKALVYIVEYSDLQCPFCSQFHPTMQKVMTDYGGKVAWIYRHFPLDSIHPQARPAAIASECVASLGGADAFWDFIDKVFADQKGTLSDMTAVAGQVGVDEAEFTKCTTEKKVESIVNDQYEGGSNAGVTGTPGSFIINTKTGNTWLIPGALPYDSLKTTLDEALK